jgi:hypothetical protein
VWYNRAIWKNTARLDCTLDNGKNLSKKVNKVIRMKWNGIQWCPNGKYWVN